MVCAREEQSQPEIRRPDSASTPRYAAGDLASSKCKPSYMKRTRTACTGPSADLVHHWGLSGYRGRVLWGPMPPVARQPDFRKTRNMGAEYFAPPSQGPKKSISASWSIRAPLTGLPGYKSIAGRVEMPRTKQGRDGMPNRGVKGVDFELNRECAATVSYTHLTLPTKA